MKIFDFSIISIIILLFIFILRIRDSIIPSRLLILALVCKFPKILIALIILSMSNLSIIERLFYEISLFIYLLNLPFLMMWTRQIFLSFYLCIYLSIIMSYGVLKLIYCNSMNVFDCLTSQYWSLNNYQK